MSSFATSKLTYVRDHHPLEQGLRQPPPHYKEQQYSVRDHHPLEQGLRHQHEFGEGGLPRVVRDHHPLEQGLRLKLYMESERFNIKVRDHHPLEQGLRLELFIQWNYSIGSPRPSSIRTRIKTDCPHCDTMHDSGVRDHHPLEQGLRRTKVNQ